MEIVQDRQIFKNEKMSAHTSFRIGGRANRLVQATAQVAVLKTLCECAGKNEKIYFIGGGSNTLFSSRKIDATILQYTNNDIYIENDTLVCSAGVMVSELLKFCLTHSIAGLEVMAGIPGTIGGAVKGNAGGVDTAIGYFVTKISGFEIECDNQNNINKNSEIILNKLKNEKTLINNQKILENAKNNVKIRKKYIKISENFFNYRKSNIKNNFFILKIYLKINYGNKLIIENKIKEFLSNKILRQPMNKRSAGSVFLRQGDFIPARAIDALGLKGERVGGVMVSNLHAGFIVNEGGASSGDVLKLIDKIRRRVRKVYGVDLICEIRYYD